MPVSARCTRAFIKGDQLGMFGGSGGGGQKSPVKQHQRKTKSGKIAVVGQHRRTVKQRKMDLPSTDPYQKYLDGVRSKWRTSPRKPIASDRPEVWDIDNDGWPRPDAQLEWNARDHGFSAELDDAWAKLGGAHNLRNAWRAAWHVPKASSVRVDRAHFDKLLARAAQSYYSGNGTLDGQSLRIAIHTRHEGKGGRWILENPTKGRWGWFPYTKHKADTHSYGDATIDEIIDGFPKTDPAPAWKMALVGTGHAVQSGNSGTVYGWRDIASFDMGVPQGKGKYAEHTTKHLKTIINDLSKLVHKLHKKNAGKESREEVMADLSNAKRELDRRGEK